MTLKTMPKFVFGDLPTLVALKRDADSSSSRYTELDSIVTGIQLLMKNQVDSIGTVWHRSSYDGRHTDGWFKKFFFLHDAIGPLMASCIPPEVKTTRREELIWSARFQIELALRNIDDQTNLMTDSGPVSVAALLHVLTNNDHPTDIDPRKTVAMMLVIANTNNEADLWKAIENGSDNGLPTFTTMLTMRMS